MRYRYYIEKMQQTFSQWRGKIPKKEHTKYTHVKVLCIVCGALYPGGCLAILAKPEGDLSFGILHAVKVAVITRQGHIGYGTSLILIVALILYIKVVGRSRDNEDERNFNYSAKGTYGTSRIATEEEYKNYLSITDNALETDGIILGTTMDGKVVSIPRDSPYNRNLFIAGSQGSFKSIAISRNMIIQCVIRGESFCVTDPKGELCGDMVYYLYSQGYEVGLWNLSNRWNSDGWDILQEISAVCDHVFIISKGALVASDSMEHLESRMSGAQQLDVVVRGTKEQLEELHTLDGVQECRIVREVPEESAESSENDLTDAAETLDSDAGERNDEAAEFHLSLIAGENCDLRETVFRYCVEHDVVLLEQKVNTKTLEDVFLELTGNEEVREA